jgi:transcriptional regulator with XRE-family HTH domain
MAKKDSEQIRDVGRRVGEIRLGLGVTQEETAERLGISLKGYQRIERGLENMTIRRLVRVADVLGVRPIDLFAVPGARVARKGRPRRQT